MSSNLYLEAIEAAEQLKNSTEEKVKQKIIESISPQIKQLVEQKLMGENEEDSDDTLGEDTLDDDSSLDSGEAQEECGSSYENVNEIKLDEESRNILSKFITQNARKEALVEKIANLKEAIKTVQKAAILAENTKTSSASKRKINLLLKNIIKEIKNIKSNSIIKTDKTLLKEYYNLMKELNNMSRRQNRKQRFLNESLDDLLEMNLFEEESDEDQEEEDQDEELDFDLEDEDQEDKEDKDSDEDSDEDLDDMIDDESDASSEISADTTVEQLAMMAGLMDEEEEELETEAFFESDMMDDDALEIADEMDEMDEMSHMEMDEMDMEMEMDEDMEMEMYGESRRRDRVLEIDENMLRREIGKMKAIREGEAKDMASHFGGGSLEGEAFVDGVELNKLHEMRNKAAKVVRKNRMLESKLAQYKKALRGMKSQLTEMNLFNAKLLYANKLMQNRDLSIKQQRHVVESLDEAKTLGEAKILFESLSKSLVSRKPSTGKNLNENAQRRVISSSKPVRSAQPIRESVALDRWATLAGIKN